VGGHTPAIAKIPRERTNPPVAGRAFSLQIGASRHSIGALQFSFAEKQVTEQHITRIRIVQLWQTTFASRCA
jgi:hypothetical protein